MLQKTIRCFLICVSLLSLAFLIVGCGNGPSDADKDAAKATVEKMLNSDTYDEFLECFSEENQQGMRNSSLWRDNWENLKHNGKPVWAISGVGGSKEKVEIKTKHIYAPDTFRSYSLIKENGKWVIHEIKLD